MVEALCVARSVYVIVVVAAPAGSMRVIQRSVFHEVPNAPPPLIAGASAMPFDLNVSAAT